MGKSLRVIFMGSPDFAVPILSALRGRVILSRCIASHLGGPDAGKRRGLVLCIGRPNRRG